MVFTNDGETIIATTTIPAVSSFQWRSGTGADEKLYSASIKFSDSSKDTPLEHATDAVWLLSKLDIQTNTLTYPRVDGVLRSSFTSQISETPLATEAEFRTNVQIMGYWDLADA